MGSIIQNIWKIRKSILLHIYHSVATLIAEIAASHIGSMGCLRRVGETVGGSTKELKIILNEI